MKEVFTDVTSQIEEKITDISEQTTTLSTVIKI